MAIGTDLGQLFARCEQLGVTGATTTAEAAQYPSRYFPPFFNALAKRKQMYLVAEIASRISSYPDRLTDAQLQDFINAYEKAKQG